MAIVTIGIDLDKNVIAVHGVEEVRAEVLDANVGAPGSAIVHNFNPDLQNIAFWFGLRLILRDYRST